jgi:hypothetical protein
MVLTGSTREHGVSNIDIHVRVLLSATTNTRTHTNVFATQPNLAPSRQIRYALAREVYKCQRSAC